MTHRPLFLEQDVKHVLDPSRNQPPRCKDLFCDLNQLHPGSLHRHREVGWMIHLKTLNAGMFFFVPGSAERRGGLHLFIFVGTSITPKATQPKFSQLPLKELSQERLHRKFHGIPLDLPCLKCKKKKAGKSRNWFFVIIFMCKGILTSKSPKLGASIAHVMNFQETAPSSLGTEQFLGNSRCELWKRQAIPARC